MLTPSLSLPCNSTKAFVPPLLTGRVGSVQSGPCLELDQNHHRAAGRTGSGCSPCTWKWLGRHCQAAGISKNWGQDGDFLPKGMNVHTWGESEISPISEEQQQYDTEDHNQHPQLLWLCHRGTNLLSTPGNQPSQVFPGWGVRPNAVQGTRDEDMSRTSKVKMCIEIHFSVFPLFLAKHCNFFLLDLRNIIQKCTSSRVRTWSCPTGPSPSWEVSETTFHLQGSGRLEAFNQFMCVVLVKSHLHGAAFP